MFAAGVQPGDEVIVPTLTFCASANAVLYQGGTPVLVDVSGSDLNLDPDLARAVVTRNTKAIVAVDYAGHPASLGSLREVADDHGLYLIEDACHALGATFEGVPVGAISDLTVFSFHPVKHVAAGEGGVVTTNDPELASRLRSFRTHGLDYGVGGDEEPWRYDMVDLGYNYRLTDMGAALGLSQLNQLDSFLDRRRKIASSYEVELAGLPLVLPSKPSWATHAWHIFPVRLALEELAVRRSHIVRALHAENIGVAVHYLPVHLLRYYQDRFGYGEGDFPIAENAYERLITLPLFPAMSDEDVADVVSALCKVLSVYAA
jgi:dTDP-4-amino-4,6-dideoxygalactose transaminase